MRICWRRVPRCVAISGCGWQPEKRTDSLGGAGANDLISPGNSQIASGAHEEALPTLARAESQAGGTVRFDQVKTKAQGRSGQLQEWLIAVADNAGGRIAD